MISGRLITMLEHIVGIIGFTATVMGTYLTYISFVNPIKRFNKYLKTPAKWEQFIGIEDHLYYYRHKKLPSFQLVIDWDRSVVENFHEEWMEGGHYPGYAKNATYYVMLQANGMLLDKELFVSLDDARWFVPVPRIEMSKTKKGEREFYYDKRQIQLANIVGKYDSEVKNIYDFAKMQSKPIKIME